MEKLEHFCREAKTRFRRFRTPAHSGKGCVSGSCNSCCLTLVKHELLVNFRELNAWRDFWDFLSSVLFSELEWLWREFCAPCDFALVLFCSEFCHCLCFWFGIWRWFCDFVWKWWMVLLLEWWVALPKEERNVKNSALEANWSVGEWYFLEAIGVWGRYCP